uniref:Uncharacterized protein MANES_05G098100 n=1 Tax=Rhizophora mucronata TaxID=61149 RepID=A0A2P2JA09_RHIMU
MENFRVCCCFLLPLLIFVMLFQVSTAQLTPSETRILFRVQRLLEYPGVLQGWARWTDFCYLPPSPSLSIVCSNGHVTELTIAGNKSSLSQNPKPSSGNFVASQQSLSSQFSIDSFFTVLTKLSNLKVLSLVSLGLWGPLPGKIGRFRSLAVLNISSNFIYGEIPQEILSVKNLSSLVLAGNMLNGSVPDLSSLVLLRELNLGGNNLGPTFPSLGDNLVTITLSNNSLRSDIPLGIKNFNQLEQLDISSNKLIGPIPSPLFSLPSIQYLDLAYNQLTGAFPANVSCTAGLKFVDISHNLLIGNLPSCIASNSLNRTVLSSWNCLSGGNSSYQQHPYSFCHREALAVKPPVKTEKQKSTIKLGLSIGVIGGVVGMAVFIGILILAVFRKSEATRSAYDVKSLADRVSVHRTSKPNVDSRRVPQTMRSAAIGLPPYRVFSLEDIEDATNNFDPLNFLGNETQGRLYKGWLEDGTVVLVKCVKLKQKNLPQNLAQHMELLSKLRHLHLVSVLGHCIVTYRDHPSIISTVFVVFEHIANGSLRDHLTDWRKKEVLKWPQRMAITIGAARGIQFLHTGVPPGIFGNNIKIEHVLLDETLTAKISNYTIPLPSKVPANCESKCIKLRPRFEGGGMVVGQTKL